MASSITDFTVPVFKSFQQEDLLLGVQKGVFIILFMIFTIISYLFGFLPGCVLTVVIYVPARILTKKDPHMISIALSSLLEPDLLEG